MLYDRLCQADPVGPWSFRRRGERWRGRKPPTGDAVRPIYKHSTSLCRNAI